MEKKLRTVILGTGRHAEVLLDCLHAREDVLLECALDQKSDLWGKSWIGIPVLGSDEKLKDLASLGITHFIIGVGGAGDNGPRMRVFEQARALGLRALNVIHPRAYISRTASLGEGVQLLAGCIVNTGAALGSNVLVNTGAIVEHHCTIGDHVHVASGATLAGTVTVGRAAHIGAGSVVRQAITIGDNAVVGAGAVVVKNVPAGIVVAGVPAKMLKSRG